MKLKIKLTEGNRSKFRRHWEVHIRAFEKSGLSWAEYCRRHNLSYHALAYRQRKISKPSNGKSQLVLVPMEKILRSRQPAANSGVKILLNDRIAIGYSYKRPAKTVPGHAPSAEEKRSAIDDIIQGIQSIRANKETVIYALDEAHFSTEPYLVQGWF